ncbi:arylesterase [Pseudomonas agarici]|uniref:Arylesterase n=1 Tax=Pseudomonas agarici TaxID=46677 RepID=A0A0X1T814_PSEAA|nr:alpha/beta hydrolase [Pseudomonas agarici]AMB88063.1 arylesterase [Pseudomonas agarici]NWB92949.1 alpha/beta hydrolase [Pseudomonas agarici]NWC09216.1 alpha/beta hydrolase [Pseudomonas agarici]SEK31455.1 Pimeloyl-ACP methyl ester carboxylesterase [Pseudomonas agarici]
MPCFHTQDGVALHYNDWGQGRPVVLIHGWPLTSESWDYQANRLVDQGLRVISYDRRGFGRSDRPWNGYDFQTFSDDLRGLIQHLKLQNAVLVGYSMGSGEVARYLGRFGAEGICGAVLLAGVTPQLAQSANNPLGMERAAFDGLKQALCDDRIGCLDGYAHATFSEVAMQQWYLHMTYQASSRAVIDSAEAWYSTDFHEDLKKFSVPTLIIHGDSDQSAPVAVTGRKAAQLIPHARYVEYKNEGHYLPFECRERVTEDLLAFLKSLPGTEC